MHPSLAYKFPIQNQSQHLKARQRIDIWLKEVISGWLHSVTTTADNYEISQRSKSKIKHVSKSNNKMLSFGFEFTKEG